MSGREELIAELEDLGLQELADDVRQGLCGCGCKNQILSRRASTVYVDERHKQRGYRRRLNAAAAAAGVAPRVTLEAVRATTLTANRNGDAQALPKAPQKRRKRSPRPGVTVYFPTPAVAELVRDVMAGPLASPPVYAPWEERQDHAEALELTGQAVEAIDAALERRRRRSA